MTDYVDYYQQINEGMKIRLRLALAIDFPITKADLQISSNESNINRGFDYFIVTKPGAFPSIGSAKSGEIQDVDWSTRLELFVRFYEKQEQWSRFEAFRDAVIFYLMKYRFLGSGTINGTTVNEVLRVEKIRSVAAAGEATYYTLLNSQVNFMFQPLIAVTRQRVIY